ncbi:MAG: AtpZ/AtpI family protein [Jiangellaceae bacterium]|nr:AtpZ/AtpI family protein [Jiangellaceae bacterium]
MTPGPNDEADDEPEPDEFPTGDEQARRIQNDAWSAVSLLAAGVAFWGGVGWLLSEWLDNRIFLMVGVLLGAGAALYLVWVRYGKA